MPVGRIIAGQVKGDGTIISGEDFTASRTTSGHYLISFRPAYNTISGASVTQIYPDGDTRDNAVIIRLNANELYLKTGDSSGNAQDRDFTFIAGGNGSKPAL